MDGVGGSDYSSYDAASYDAGSYNYTDNAGVVSDNLGNNGVNDTTDANDPVAPVDAGATGYVPPVTNNEPIPAVEELKAEGEATRAKLNERLDNPGDVPQTEQPQPTPNQSELPQDVKDILPKAIDEAEKRLGFSLPNEVKEQISQQLQGLLDQAKKFGADPTNLSRIDVAFKVAGTVYGVGLKGSYNQPLVTRDADGNLQLGGDGKITVGVSTPGSFRTNVAVSATFDRGDSVSQLPINGVAQGIPIGNGRTIDYKTNNREIQLQTNVIGAQSNPGAALEMSFNAREVVDNISQGANYLAGLSPNQQVDYWWNQQTKALDEAKGQNQRETAEIDQRYDELLSNTTDPSMRKALEQEREQQHIERVRRYGRTQDLISEFHREQVRRVLNGK